MILWSYFQFQDNPRQQIRFRHRNPSVTYSMSFIRCCHATSLAHNVATRATCSDTSRKHSSPHINLADRYTLTAQNIYLEPTAERFICVVRTYRYQLNENHGEIIIMSEKVAEEYREGGKLRKIRGSQCFVPRSNVHRNYLSQIQK